MAYNYDALYAENPNALGDPTQVFVDFFATYDHPNARVLDIGCGQGRDALFIARLGHCVTGVDLSPRGIQDMIEAAAREGLSIDGVVADLTDFSPSGTFNVVVIDRTLHMLDTEPRLAALNRVLPCVAPDGWVLIADEKSNIAGFRALFDADRNDWDVGTAKRGTLFMKRLG